MHNEIITIGPVTIYGYGLMIGIGIIMALLIACRRGRKFSLNEDIIWGITLNAVIFGFLGAKILFCISDWRNFIQNPMSALSQNGFVVYGGIMSGALAAYIYCRIKKVNFLDYFDIVMPSIAIAQGFGRIGCFLAGCCYGRETHSFLGVIFSHSDFAPNGVKLLPTQLFSSAGDFLLAGILIWYASKKRASGTVGALYLILYSIGRFLVEIFRADERGAIFGMSTSQFISIPVLVVGIALMIYFSKRTERAEEN